MLSRRFFFGFLLIILAHFSFAQLPNQAFRKWPEINPENVGELRLGVQALGFFKNNEYFDKIADGYTLFGYHFMPSLKYYHSEKVKLEGGLLLWKDFGSLKIQQIQPTFTLTYITGNHTLLFGTLAGNLTHNYIEPLWDFERQLTRPLQNGIQYGYETNKVALDAWIDWQLMQYAYDARQEEIAGGLSSAFKLIGNEGIFKNATDSVKRPGFILTLPFQFTAKHIGGQIDTNERPLTTLFNGAIGFEATKYLAKTVSDSGKKPFLHSLYTKNYLVGYDDYSFENLLPFQRGSGIYLNAGADTKLGDIMLSYWRGNGYISEFGGRLYQSVSTTVSSPGYLEEDRELIILRIMSTFPITKGVTFTNRLEPFYNLRTGSGLFSTGFYVHFDTDFFLGHPKHKAKTIN